MKKHAIWLLCTAMLILIPRAGTAYMSAAPPGPGSIIMGCCAYKCAYSVGRIATPIGVKMSFGWFETTLTMQINKIARSYKDGQNRITSMTDKSMSAQDAAIREIFKGYYQATEKTQNQRMFNPRAASFDDRDPEDPLLGEETSVALSKQLGEGVGEYVEGFEKKRDIAQHYEEKEPEEIDPTSVFPHSGTMSVQDTQNALWVMRTLTDPFPATEIGEDASEEDVYQAAKRVKRVHSMAIEAILSDIMSSYAPTMEVDSTLQEMYEKAGGEGNIPQAKEGRISPVGYMGTLIETRFAGQEYRTGKEGLHGMAETGLIRELAAVQALRLEVERRKMKRAQQMAFIAAQNASVAAFNLSAQIDAELEKILTRGE